MERKVFCHESGNGEVKSVTVFHVNGKECNGYQITKVVQYNGEVEYCYWVFDDLLNGDEFNREENTLAFLMRNEYNGFSCSPFTTATDALDDMEDGREAIAEDFRNYINYLD